MSCLCNTATPPVDTSPAAHCAHSRCTQPAAACAFTGMCTPAAAPPAVPAALCTQPASPAAGEEGKTDRQSVGVAAEHPWQRYGSSAAAATAAQQQQRHAASTPRPTLAQVRMPKPNHPAARLAEHGKVEDGRQVAPQPRALRLVQVLRAFGHGSAQGCMAGLISRVGADADTEHCRCRHGPAAGHGWLCTGTAAAAATWAHQHGRRQPQ